MNTYITYSLAINYKHQEKKDKTSAAHTYKVILVYQTTMPIDTSSQGIWKARTTTTTILRSYTQDLAHIHSRKSLEPLGQNHFWDVNSPAVEDKSQVERIHEINETKLFFSPKTWIITGIAKSASTDFVMLHILFFDKLLNTIVKMSYFTTQLLWQKHVTLIITTQMYQLN